jgi:uncharacterized protein (TIGR02147 family)
MIANNDPSPTQLPLSREVFFGQRNFLSLITWLRSESASLHTWESLASVLGLQTRSQIKSLFKEGKHFQAQHLLRFLDLFDVTDDHKQYAEALRLLSLSKDVKKVLSLHDFTEALRQKHLPQSSDMTITPKNYAPLLADWSILALFYSLQLKGIEKREDLYQAFQGQLSKEHIDQVLITLQEFSLVQEEDNILTACDKNLFTNLDHVPHILIKNYHASLLDKAKKAIYHSPEQERHLLGASVIMSAEQIAIAKKMIDDFCLHFHQTFSQTKKGDQLHQLNIQFHQLVKAGASS